MDLFKNLFVITFAILIYLHGKAWLGMVTVSIGAGNI